VEKSECQTEKAIVEGLEKVKKIFTLAKISTFYQQRVGF